MAFIVTEGIFIAERDERLQQISHGTENILEEW